MDSYREVPSDFEPASDGGGPSASEEVSLAIGTDERRMHVRAYNYWVSLLDGRDYPSIEDLEPGDVRDFADHSVLLDFSAGREDPATPYIGAAIREECAIGDEVRTIADVPSRSLLSRLTDHYLQIIANRAPVGFEAEFANQHGETICYRGILMPFSSDGDTIDFIYGVINWKKTASAIVRPEAESAPEAGPEFAVENSFTGDFDQAVEVQEPAEETVEPAHADAEDEPQGDELPELDLVPSAVPHFSWQDGPLHDPELDVSLAEIAIDPDAGLADCLCAARDGAEALKMADSRSRSALYQALSLAYDFALVAEARRDDYAELLEDSGVKAQARAPMTPIVKLVFGIDYDKARLTEFAAALSYAKREQVEAGGFQALIEGEDGGLKGLVAAERRARRPEPKPDRRGDDAKAKLRAAPPIKLEDVSAGSEFALVLARRGEGGGVEAIALVDDEAMIAKAIRRAAS